MALKEFTTQQMVRVTGFWLADGRPIIEASPDLAGSLPVLRRAHQGLILPPKSTAITEAEREVQELQQKQKGVDLSYDRTGRGLIYLLLAYAQFARTAEEEADVSRVLRELFPLHLDTTMQSYEEEAGSVELLEGKLSDDVQGILKGIPLPNGESALDKVKAHIEAGRALGALEQKKGTLRDSLSPSTGNPELQAARLYWVRAVNMFLSLLTVAAISEEERSTLREPVLKAEEVATRRRRGEVAAEDEPVIIEEEKTN